MLRLSLGYSDTSVWVRPPLPAPPPRFPPGLPPVYGLALRDAALPHSAALPQVLWGRPGHAARHAHHFHLPRDRLLALPPAVEHAVGARRSHAGQQRPGK